MMEILLLHHSHLDVGYTHRQPVLRELHGEYLDQALDLLDRTADWEPGSRPAWTVEVTEPLLHWLATASSCDEERFRAHVQSNRIGLSALALNTTPLCTREQLVRQLLPVRELEARFGIRIRTVNQHDVNGVPWPLADLMAASGLDLLIMAVNPHLGGVVRPRPGVFRWEAPSGREIVVLNGCHYTMFDQITRSWEGSLDTMQAGLDRYLEHLEGIGYPHDFLYLTTTAVPHMWDNSPPHARVARLVREWNRQGRAPRIRYVTPDDLRNQLLDLSDLPRLRGDWTDYWNFGCASTARETAINRETKDILFAADFLHALGPAGADAPRRRRSQALGWDQLNLYDEHTWSHLDTDPAHPVFQATLHTKLQAAHEARGCANHAVISGLEALAGSPVDGDRVTALMLVNLAGRPRAIRPVVPEAWLSGEGLQLRANRFQGEWPLGIAWATQVCEAVEVPAYGWRTIALTELRPWTGSTGLTHGIDRETRDRAHLNLAGGVSESDEVGWMESPWHRLAYDPRTGRILSLCEKTQGREWVDSGADFEWFDLVRERPDALRDGDRTFLYKRDLDKERVDQSCWQPDPRFVRERPVQSLGCEVREGPGTLTLVRRRMAGFAADLEQRITLRDDSPVIDLEVSFVLPDRPEPEAIHVVMPTPLASDWQACFDTAGEVVRLDEDQLPGACRDWFTAGSFVSLWTPEAGLTLLTPDAPIAMAGDFGFGPPRESIPRPARPKLLSMVTNNYWDTNFPRSQPGRLRFRYGLLLHRALDEGEVRRHVLDRQRPVIAWPCAEAGPEAQGSLVNLSSNVTLEGIRESRDGQGVVVTLRNESEAAEEVACSLNVPVSGAALCDPFETALASLDLTTGTFRFTIGGRATVQIKLTRGP